MPNTIERQLERIKRTASLLPVQPETEASGCKMVNVTERGPQDAKRERAGVLSLELMLEDSVSAKRRGWKSNRVGKVETLLPSGKEKRR